MAARNLLQQGRLRRLRDIEPLAIAAHALARAVDDLPACRFAPLDHRRDLAVADVEDVVQQESGALLGRKPFEQREEGHRKIIGQVEVAIRRRRRDDRLRQPLTDVGLALGLEPPQPIDRQPARCRDEPRFRILDLVVLRLVPADVRVLDDILGIGARAEHAIGEAEQAAAQRLESGRRDPGLRHTFILCEEDG